MNHRSRKQPVDHGIPALVLLPTGKTVIIAGKQYRVLELSYDLKGKYLKPAMIIPR